MVSSGNQRKGNKMKDHIFRFRLCQGINSCFGGTSVCYYITKNDKLPMHGTVQNVMKQTLC